jgi:PKD repeat protein
MWEWYDPKAGGGCGNLSSYLQGDTTARDPEGHWSGPTSPPDGIAKERHCIRPGRYRFTVADQSFLVDYHSIKSASGGVLWVWNETAGIYEALEGSPDDTANRWVDLLVNVDIGSNSYEETRVLSVENAGRRPDTTVFEDQASPSGGRRDWFRFSTAGSSTTWPGDAAGTGLLRLYWDAANKTIRTNYYAPVSSISHLIRLHTFEEHVQGTRDVTVALELMRPDEDPDDTVNVTQRVVHVEANAPPIAGFSVSCQQLPCAFTDTSTDPDGSIVAWRWAFGDGDSSSQQNPSHTYADGGTYTVRLIVTDDEAAADTATGTAAPLQLGITGPTVVKPKVTCEWDAYPQGGSGGMTYSWRIGGQEVGTEEYLYWYTGRSGFQITLLGWAGDGQVDTAVVTVTVTKSAPSCVLKRG